ncbi:MAG: PLP-dependent transferase, partial [Burkholderiales bacterium]
LQTQPEVERILCPALADDPGHTLWRRDFEGASGLFGVVLKPTVSEVTVTAMLDGLKLFGLGYSWGGYESLILPTHPAEVRSATRWQSGPTLRIHAGLEDPQDLIADFELGFERLRKT